VNLVAAAGLRSTVSTWLTGVKLLSESIIMRFFGRLCLAVLTLGSIYLPYGRGQHEPQKDVHAIDLPLAHRYFEQARALAEVDGGRLWGKNLYGPMLFVDPATRAIVANQGDRGKTLRPQRDLWVGTLPPKYGIAKTALVWNGIKWTMVIWPLPDDRYARGRLLMHELFHRIQEDLGLPMADPDNPHLATRDGRIWLRLEWRALREALIRGGEQRQRVMVDALVFRAYRYRLFPKAADTERCMELNEGLAEYTGLRLSGLPTDVLADRAAVQLTQQEQQPSFVRSFAYASGPAYGILLDGSGLNWRHELSSKSDLVKLLASALKIELPNGEAREARRRAERYDGDRVIAAETQREQSRQHMQANFRSRFIDGPVLELPATNDVRYTFNPQAVEVLERGGGTVYLTARVTDAWGVLTVTSGGVLLVRDANGRVKGWRVPAPPDPHKQPLHGDGWSLESAKGWTLQPGPRRGDWRRHKGF